LMLLVIWFHRQCHKLDTYLFNIWRNLPRFGSSCTDLFTKKVGYFLLHCTLYSHIFSLVVQISDSQAPSERAVLKEKDKSKWILAHEKPTHYFNNKETQSSAIHFSMAKLNNSNKFIHVSRDVFGIFCMGSQLDSFKEHSLEQFQQAIVRIYCIN